MICINTCIHVTCTFNCRQKWPFLAWNEIRTTFIRTSALSVCVILFDEQWTFTSLQNRGWLGFFSISDILGNTESIISALLVITIILLIFWAIHTSCATAYYLLYASVFHCSLSFKSVWEGRIFITIESKTICNIIIS